MTGRRIAILIDGGFFIRRLPKLVKASDCDKPERIADRSVELSGCGARTGR